MKLTDDEKDEIIKKLENIENLITNESIGMLDLMFPNETITLFIAATGSTAYNKILKLIDPKHDFTKSKNNIE